VGRRSRFDGRSFVGLVLAPKAPFEDWLTALDGWIGRSWIFTSRPIIVDFSKATPTRPQLVDLLAQVKARGLRVVAVEGVDQDWLTGLDKQVPGGGAKAAAGTARAPGEAPPASDSSTAKPAGLLLDRQVRSGETVTYPDGDVTVLGSIASGAEVIAGGSIHVYGSLRGRAIAGNENNPKARLFCRHFEPELVAINGFYCTAEEVDPALLRQPVQAWLEGSTINMCIME
jgi:septum site-determining protein MinC